MNFDEERYAQRVRTAKDLYADAIQGSFDYCEEVRDEIFRWLDKTENLLERCDWPQVGEQIYADHKAEIDEEIA